MALRPHHHTLDICVLGILIVYAVNLIASICSNQLDTSSTMPPAAPAIKLPLLVKKALRDKVRRRANGHEYRCGSRSRHSCLAPDRCAFVVVQDAAKIASLAQLSEIVGAPVTFDWSVEDAWKALEGHGSREDLVSIVLEEYLPTVIEASDAHTRTYVGGHLT
jgi:hypothetical protein